jgi:peptidoglycan biosynthesis protein MviN/MurJ (putative lipid II flippase)
LAGTLASLLAVPAYMSLAPRMGAAGVALVTSLSLAVYAVALLAVARRRWGGEAFAGLGKTAWRSLLLAAPGFVLTLAVTAFFAAYGTSLPLLFRQFAALALSGCLFAAVSLALARFVLPEFLTALPGPLRRLCGGPDRNGRGEE